ncbi:MAG: histone deacetylase [Anaerolineae bacterium]|nr:histone deacetylase [Anaerolineae bacterium]
MQAFYADHFVLPLPEDHRFPMRKYAMLREQAVATGILAPHELRVPEAATDEQLLRVHDADYLRKVTTGTLTEKEIRRMGFPWSPQLVERSRRSVGGTISACRAALDGDGIAVTLAGGTHHAHVDFGSGFCVFNDAAVAARAMQAEQLVQVIAVIDCDVHQGDGTAAILRDDASVFTFSIHGARNFPFRKQHSDLDIGLDDGVEDTLYLDALRAGVIQTLTRSEPDLVIYLAGADPFVGDRLGRLALSKEGLAARDQFVLGTCMEQGIPVAVTMSGGYAKPVQDIVDIHLQTLRIARTQWEMYRNVEKDE